MNPLTLLPALVSSVVIIKSVSLSLLSPSLSFLFSRDLMEIRGGLRILMKIDVATLFSVSQKSRIGENGATSRDATGKAPNTTIRLSVSGERDCKC